MTPETCPNCGANVPPRARSCPGCGADERTGWSEEATVDRLGLPPDPDSFDHGAWERSEFGDRAARRGGGKRSLTPAERRRKLWTWVALALLAAMLAGWFAF